MQATAITGGVGNNVILDIKLRPGLVLTSAETL